MKKSIYLSLSILAISIFLSGCFLLDSFMTVGPERWFADGDTVDGKGWDFEAGEYGKINMNPDLVLTKEGNTWYLRVVNNTKQFIRDVGVKQIRDYYWKSTSDLEALNNGSEKAIPKKAHLYIVKTIEGNYAIIKLIDVQDDPVVIFKYAMKQK